VIRNARRGCAQRLVSAKGGCTGRSTTWHPDGTHRTRCRQARSRLAGVMPESSSRLVSLHDVDAARSAKDAWASRSSSAIRHRSSTTPTGHPRPQRSRWGTRQTPPSWRRRSNGSPPAPKHAPRGDRRSRLWRGICGARPAPARRAQRGDPAQEQTDCRTPRVRARRAFRERSNGAPDPKDGSTTSSAATAGTAPNSPASTGRTWCGHGVFAHNLVKIGGPHSMNPPAPASRN